MALSSGDADRELIVDIASNAILRSDEDPAVVIRAAKKRVGRRLGVIQNLRAYATRTINAALERAAIAKKEKEQSVCQYDVERIADLGREQIENQVLVREALEVLSAQDREIVIRRMAGDPYSEIERDMTLKPRTAETRFRAAMRILRRFLDNNIERQTGSRVG